LLRQERHREISQLIRENGKATVVELSRLFRVSKSTIRRDLEQLDEHGVIQRAHGGALVAEHTAPEPPVIQRIVEKAEEKRRIGRAAADLVLDGESIFIGSGTTTLEVARNLADRENLTVITNALNVANVLAGHSNVTLVVVGGLLRHSELSMLGYIAEQAIKELNADKVVMGMRAIDTDYGLTSDYLPETMTDRAIIQSGRQLILVADHSKLGKVSTALVAPTTALHTLVTDSAASMNFVAKLRELGVQVILA
jgi:DeoR family transcriptional regulator of aga operon